MCFFDNANAQPKTFEEEQEEDAPAESFYRSWPTLVCDGLSAQCHNAAWSGFGMAEK